MFKSQAYCDVECPEKHLGHIDGASWMVTTTDVSAKYFSAGGVSQILVLSVFRAAANGT